MCYTLLVITAGWLGKTYDSAGLVWTAGIVFVVACVMKFLSKRRRKTIGYDGLFTLLGLTYPFSQGFYKRVESWLREVGDDPAADEVFHGRRKRETGMTQRPPWVADDPGGPVMKCRHWLGRYAGFHGAMAWQEPNPEGVPPERDGRGSWGKRFWAWLVDLTTGFGARPARLIHLFALLWLLNTGIFLDTNSVERPIAYVQPRNDLPWTRDRVLRPTTQKNPWDADGGFPEPGEWDGGHAFFIAMRLQLPLVNLLAENDFTPASRPMSSTARWLPWITYQNYASLMMAINLLLVPIIIAGATGLLKRDR